MLETQRLLLGLFAVLLLGGLSFLLVSQSSLTGATVADNSKEVFCYRSYSCQSGIECMFPDERRPFCSQPAALDQYTGQQYGEPCHISQQGVVSCPFEGEY